MDTVGALNVRLPTSSLRSQWWSCPITSPEGFAPPVSLSPPRPLGLTFSLSASQKTSFCWFDSSFSFQPVRNPHGIFLLEFRSGPQRCLSRPCSPVENPSAWLPPDGTHPLSKARSPGARRTVQTDPCVVPWTGKRLRSPDPEALTALLLLMPTGPANGTPAPVLV